MSSFVLFQTMFANYALAAAGSLESGEGAPMSAI